MSWQFSKPEKQAAPEKISEAKYIRLVSQSRLKELQKLTGKAQVEALLKLLREGDRDG